MVSALNKLLAPLRNRIANLVARAVVQLVSDGGKLQVLQLSILDGETREALERVQEYGFTSHPMPGAEAVALFVGGRRDHGLVVAVDDRRYRPTGLQPGEVAVYHKDGASIILKADGSVEVTAKAGADIVLNGGTTGLALADHTHQVAGVTAGSASVTTGVSSSNAATVKA